MDRCLEPDLPNILQYFSDITWSTRLEVYAYGERNQAIEKCRTSLFNNGGDLLDFKMFSDMLVNFIIEIPEKNISNLQSTLEGLNWKTELKLVENHSRIDCLAKIQGTMSVTFVLQQT